MIDLTGQKFGKLLVLKQVGKDRWGSYKWLCICDCGKEIIAQSGNLKNRHTKSCGCLIIKILTKHGYGKKGRESKTYKSWLRMNQRCNNPNNKQWKNYGGRGIKICKRWKNFRSFLKDMGERPTKNHSIDRIDNDDDYYKKNCQWATIKQQNRNSRNNRLETYNNKTRCLIEWAEEYKIPYRVLWNRLYKLDWSMEKAFMTPVKKYPRRKM